MKKQISILVSIVLIFSGLINPGIVNAADKIQSGFNANKLIDDRTFKDTSTFSGPEGIQSFLESKGSILANKNESFTSLLREPSDSNLKQTLEDPHASSNKKRTAAELIWDASKSSGLNPQVILVTLNKEQSLITGHQNSDSARLQRALDFAMGFGCPDSQACGEIYRGFYGQLFGGVDSENNRYLGAAKSLMKSATTPGGRGPLFNGKVSKVGDTITLGNTLGGYDGVESQQSVTISNAATAALYRYTPHVFNGNYNFWRFFKAWFGGGSGGSDIGGLVKRGTTLYKIENGKKLRIFDWVAEANKLSVRNAEKVSSSELSDYPNGGYLAPIDNTVIKVDGKYFVFIGGVRRPASEFAMKQRGIDFKNAEKVSSSEAKQFTLGAALTPPDGAVLRSETGSTVFLVEGSALKEFTAETLKQHNASSKVQVIPDAEISTYPRNGMVAALNTTKLVKGSGPAVYLIENGQKTALTYDMFVSKGFSFANVVTITDSELGNYPSVAGQSTPPPAPAPSANTPPATTTWFSNTKTGEFWVWMSGVKHLISSFVAKQKGMTPDVQFEQSYIDSLPTGKPIMPKDGTIVKGSKPDVYLISGGLAQPLTYAAFQARSITPAQINILPQAEVDGYPKGALITQ